LLEDPDMHRFSTLLAGALAALALSPAAVSAFPDRPLNIVVPFGAGGSTDQMTRGLAAEMSQVLGQSIVVMNIAGAGGTIGATRVANAEKDGYTVGMLPVGPLATQPHLQKLQYDADSFDYVCLVYANPQALIVKADSPFRTVADLLNHARDNPGKLNYGSSGIGGIPHLAMVALGKAAGVEMTHVPHKGDADSMLSLLRGDVAAFVSHTAVLATHARDVRALGLMSDRRLAEYPTLPTLAEQGAPPLSFDVWGGLVVPKGTPAPVVAALENACRTGTGSESFRKLLQSLQTPFNYMDGQTFGRFVKGEFGRYGTLLRDAGIKKD
jgi:tripartite-type tricarboxylate transporter receptor subunit TctC